MTEPRLVKKIASQQVSLDAFEQQRLRRRLNQDSGAQRLEDTQGLAHHEKDNKD